jgi:deoxyribodipyrimidine photo-lyase
MIQPQRIRDLNHQPIRDGHYILYWMQASQRAQYNHALEYAIRQANHRHMPLVVLFVLTENFPEANLRHYTFMLEGLKEVQQILKRRGIPFVMRYGRPETEILKLAGDAAMLVNDRGYLRVQKAWRQCIAEEASCRVVEVETDVVIPVETASEKEAYSAATLRPKIRRLLPDYMVALTETPVRQKATGFEQHGLSLQQSISDLLRPLPINRNVSAVSTYEGGTSKAEKFLAHFITHHLKSYPEKHNDPLSDCTSYMSPYLHFGQISPLSIALKVQEAAGIPGEAKEAFLEELIVRRELAMNFTHFNEKYDSYDCLSEWAKRTLQKHEKDERPYLYTLEEFEGAQTHDPYWNAAQTEMIKTGKMHSYMRMYWGKKIIEWCARPEEAYDIALYLNNRYELDGRDPNSFAGITWCFGKHDRPWAERNIFGTVRYMNAGGLQRKFKIERYVQKVAAIPK